MKITMLGSGTSHGIPVIGCSCHVCRSTNPKDKRLRSSLLVEKDGFSLIVDTGPDFRFQALSAGLNKLDMVLLTHTHNDHIAGLDDVRPLTRDKALRVGGSAKDLDFIRMRFDYFFKPQKMGGGVPQIELFEVNEKTEIASPVRIEPVKIFHGETPILGYKIGNMAYLTDITSIADGESEKLKNLDLLILGVLRERAHETHMNLDKALKLIEKLKPAQVYFTHICHEILHEDWAKKMPSCIQPGWDGLVLHL